MSTTASQSTITTSAPTTITTTVPSTVTTTVPSTTTTTVPSTTTTTEPSTTTTTLPSTTTTTTATPPITEPFKPCYENDHPSSCLSSSNNCSFCFDSCFGKGADDIPRCDTYENLLAEGCHSFELDHTAYDTVLNTSTNCTTWLPIQPGEKKNISVTFSLEKHPLDLYYLMDFSSSMSDDQS